MPEEFYIRVHQRTSMGWFYCGSMVKLEPMWVKFGPKRNLCEMWIMVEEKQSLLCPLGVLSYMQPLAFLSLIYSVSTILPDSSGTAPGSPQRSHSFSLTSLPSFHHAVEQKQWVRKSARLHSNTDFAIASWPWTLTYILWASVSLIIQYRYWTRDAPGSFTGLNIGLWPC